MLSGDERSNKSDRKSLLSPHQVGTEHEEADEVEVGQVAPTAELLPRLDVGLWVTASARKSRQHNLLPLLSCGTPTGGIRPLIRNTQIYE